MKAGYEAYLSLKETARNEWSAIQQELVDLTLGRETLNQLSQLIEDWNAISTLLDGEELTNKQI